MTQTNQNKDYSWLDPIFLQYHAELNQGLNELAGHGTALEQAKAAIQQHIDEHYIGKGEAEKIAKAYGGCTKCYGKGYASYITAHSGTDTDQDIGSPGGRYYKKVDEMRFCSCGRGAQLESEVEQRCIEARIDPFDLVEPCEPDCSPERHAYHQGQWDMAERLSQLSTNNKDTPPTISYDKRPGYFVVETRQGTKIVPDPGIRPGNKDTLERSE